MLKENAMFQEIKLEFKNGQKVYLFELLSLIGFIFFLILGAKIPVLTTTSLGNIIMFGWILINGVVLVIYEMHDFAELLLNGKKASKNVVKNLLIKCVLFITLFMINIFPITALMMLSGMRLGIDMSLPFLALMVGLLMVSFARKSIPSVKILTILGCLWFISTFAVLYLLYPLLYIGIVTLVKQEMIASTFSSILLFGTAVLIFYQLIKKIKQFLVNK